MFCVRRPNENKFVYLARPDGILTFFSFAEALIFTKVAEKQSGLSDLQVVPVEDTEMAEKELSGEIDTPDDMKEFSKKIAQMFLDMGERGVELSAQCVRNGVLDTSVMKICMDEDDSDGMWSIIKYGFDEDKGDNGPWFFPADDGSPQVFPLKAMAQIVADVTEQFHKTPFTYEVISEERCLELFPKFMKTDKRDEALHSAEDIMSMFKEKDE